MVMKDFQLYYSKTSAGNSYLLWTKGFSVRQQRLCLDKDLQDTLYFLIANSLQQEGVFKPCSQLHIFNLESYFFFLLVTSIDHYLKQEYWNTSGEYTFFVLQYKFYLHIIDLISSCNNKHKVLQSFVTHLQFMYPRFFHNNIIFSVQNSLPFRFCFTECRRKVFILHVALLQIKKGEGDFLHLSCLNVLYDNIIHNAPFFLSDSYTRSEKKIRDTHFTV